MQGPAPCSIKTLTVSWTHFILICRVQFIVSWIYWHCFAGCSSVPNKDVNCFMNTFYIDLQGPVPCSIKTREGLTLLSVECPTPKGDPAVACNVSLEMDIPVDGEDAQSTHTVQLSFCNVPADKMVSQTTSTTTQSGFNIRPASQTMA